MPIATSVLACNLHSLCHYYLSHFAKSLFGALYLLELPDIVGNTATDKEKSSHFVCHASSDQFRKRNFRLALFTLLNFPCAHVIHVFFKLYWNIIAEKKEIKLAD